MNKNTIYFEPKIASCTYCKKEFNTKRAQRRDIHLKITKNIFCSQECFYKNKIGKKSTGRGNTKYSVDESYFYHVDTEEKAYWLGYIAADGCVYLKGQYQLSISSIDLDHLEKFKKCINYTGPIKNYESRPREYNLLINNKTFVENLVNKGIMERKTFHLLYPWFLPKHLMRHYIRGYLDGDGCVYKKGHSPAMTLVGNFNLIKGVSGFLLKEDIITNDRINKATNSNVFVFERSYKQGRDVLEYLYKESNIYMDRKYNKYLNLLEIYKGGLCVL